eukprot:GHUV01035936.1.p1 GENE.GHUV01035936.1~~GHUV01035936.1.p1  ORF type:complete len:105 (+),score=30.64 GHUV01035936.1:229-543(+)
MAHLHDAVVSAHNAQQDKKMGMDGVAMSPAALAEMVGLIDEGIISGKIAKDVLPRLLQGQGNKGVRAFVEAEGLVQISGGTRGSAQGNSLAHGRYLAGVWGRSH